jgi:hypothetical protein
MQGGILMDRVRDPYRTERHYMRGPGPKHRAKAMAPKGGGSVGICRTVIRPWRRWLVGSFAEPGVGITQALRSRSKELPVDDTAPSDQSSPSQCPGWLRSGQIFIAIATTTTPCTLKQRGFSAGVAVLHDIPNRSGLASGNGARPACSASG